MANALDAFNQNYDVGYGRQQKFQDLLTNRQAGASLAAGDYGGAAGTLYKAGDLEGGSQVQNYGQAQEDRAAKQEEAKAVQELKFLKAASDALGEVNGSNPQETERLRSEAFDAHVVPALKVQGANDDMIQKMRSAGFSNDVLRTFGTQIGQALDQLQVVNRGNGAYDVTNMRTGGLVRSVAPFPQYQKLGENEGLVELTPGGQPQGGGSPGLAGGPADNVWEALKAQESGGRAGAIGPQTQYGQAQGIAQVLPQTGQAMAQKLGVPWRPDLMTATSPEGAQYQEMIGKAYFEEGLQKYNGDVAKALAYYHGGPNEALWGPKTQQYVSDVLARSNPTQVAGPAMAGGGARVIAQGQPKPEDPLKALQIQKLQGDIDKQRTEAEANTRAKQLATQAIRDKTNVVTAAVDDALKAVGPLTSGLLGGNMSEVKGLGAYDLARQIDTIKANLSFDELQKMRAASPTGGALGAVSDREIQLLSSTVASLDVGQSPPQLRSNLQKVREHYQNWAKAVEQSNGSPPSASASAISQPKPQASSRTPPSNAPKGAQVGRDGKLYIADPNKPGSFPEVRQAPNGNWYIQSADGQFFKVN